MLSSLHWRTALEAPEARTQLHELRTATLRLFLAMSAVGYLAWHYVNALTWPGEQMFRVYRIAPLVVPVLVATYVLLPRSRRVATGIFIGGGLLAITWAINVLETPQGVMLYPLVALMAAFVVHPLGGFLVVGAAAGLIALLGTVRPGLVEAADIWFSAIFGSLAVVGAWALVHHLFIALRWYVDGYAEADRRSREAREHRAQLVQAWQQLDTAYYRLERANAALQLAWKAADEAERSKMELAINLSHELRTPLNLIVGYSEMMMTAPGSYGCALPPAYRGDLSAIYRSAQHLLAMTDDILDLARLEVGHLGLHPEPVDLTQVIRDAAALIQDYAEARGLELRLELATDVPRLMLDRLRIRQVLINLLSNAVRFTEQGHIEVRLLQREEDVWIGVSDTGPGLAPDEVPRIFDRFVSRDTARADWRSGTGLGLPISKRFVDAHGGKMGVESAIGRGTTFWFTLPLVPADGPFVAPDATTTAPGYLRDSEQTLVVAHDDLALGRFLQRHLEGYRVEVAHGLADAAARALALRARAIIVGLDASADDETVPVPIVRCPIPRVERFAEGLGVADYLVKPVTREALIQAIQRIESPIRSVLIVDDDPRFVRLLRRMLGAEDRDYRVATAHNGEDALARMRADPPDLLLLDLAMPGLDGFAVLKQMRLEPSLANVQVIVISAHQEGEGGMPLSGEIRISKPDGFQLAELTQIIAAAVSKMAPVRAYLAAREPAP